MKSPGSVITILGASQVFGETEVINVTNLVKSVWAVDDRGLYYDAPPLEEGHNIATELKYHIAKNEHLLNGDQCFDTTGLRDMIVDKFQKISADTNITFTETDSRDDSQLRFHYCDIKWSEAGGFAAYPNDFGYSEVVIGKAPYVNLKKFVPEQPIYSPAYDPGGVTHLVKNLFQDFTYDDVIFHEILHALGLQHTHNHGLSGNTAIEDSLTGTCSIMSYDAPEGINNWGPVDAGGIVASYLYGKNIDQENFDGFSIVGNGTKVEFDSECRSKTVKPLAGADIEILSSFLQIVSAAIGAIVGMTCQIKKTSCSNNVDSRKRAIAKKLEKLDKTGLGKLGFRTVFPVMSKISSAHDIISHHVIDDIIIKSCKDGEVDIVNAASSVGKTIVKIGSDVLFYSACNSIENNLARWTAYSVVDVQEIIQNFSEENNKTSPKSVVQLVKNLTIATVKSLPLCGYLATCAKRDNQVYALGNSEQTPQPPHETSDIENQFEIPPIKSTLSSDNNNESEDELEIRLPSTLRTKPQLPQNATGKKLRAIDNSINIGI